MLYRTLSGTSFYFLLILKHKKSKQIAVIWQDSFSILSVAVREAQV